jgi:hypothetical protein
MSANKLLAFAALGLTCVAAAAGGGYLASRPNSPAAGASSEVAAPAGDVKPVQETEAVLETKPEQAAPAPAPVDTVTATPARQQPRPAAARPAPARPAPRTDTTATRAAEPPALQQTWPSSAANQEASVLPAPEPVDPPALQAPEPPQEPEKVFEELVVSANSVIGLQLDSTVTTERAAVEDRVEARVVRDVRAGNEVAIPAGSRALGSVMVVERGGKFKDRARLGIRFHTLVLADGTRLPITSETIYRYGDAPGNASAAKIGGGAVAGAIVGAIIGGAKGAAVGATAGAGGGTAAVMAGDAKPASFPSGSEVTARILSPVTVTIER